jgi:hypothetical protein
MTPTKAPVKFLNISKLQVRFGLDRATIRKRLAAAGIESDPSSTEKEKLYVLNDALEIALKTPENLLDAERLRKLRGEATIVEMKIKQQNGELISAAECAEAVNQIFGNLRKKLALQLPKALAKRLSKMSDEAEMAKLLSEATEKVFKELRANHEKFLK